MVIVIESARSTLAWSNLPRRADAEPCSYEAQPFALGSADIHQQVLATYPGARPTSGHRRLRVALAGRAVCPAHLRRLESVFQ